MLLKFTNNKHKESDKGENNKNEETLEKSFAMLERK
jgi:hypothetical protein